jgi:hypothetical protein
MSPETGYPGKTYKRGFFVEFPHSFTKRTDVLGGTRPEVLKNVLNPETCQFLADRNWGISIATIDLDEPTAQVIKEINTNFPHLPIVFWVVLPEKEGYYTGKTTIARTIKRVSEIERWVNDNNLEINGLGFDSEPPLQLVKDASAKALARYYSSLWELRRENPEQQLNNLISDVHHKDIPTEGYIGMRPSGFILRTPNLKNVGTRFTMTYTSALPDKLRKLALHHGLVPGTYPAVGEISSLTVGTGQNFGPDKWYGEEGLAYDMRVIAEIDPRRLDRFRVFALTGLEVAQWTDEALKAAGIS